MSPVLLNPSIFGGGGAPTAYKALVLSLSPKVYYGLDDPSGSTCTDASTNARNATYFNTPTLNQASMLTDGTGKSMAVASNSGQSVALAGASWMDPSPDLSVACIVKLNGAVDTSAGDAIVTRFQSTGWLLWRFQAGGNFSVRFGTTGGIFQVHAPSIATLGQKYHLGFRYTPTTLTLFVNGLSVGSTACSGTPVNDGQLAIGTYASSSGTTPDMNIDEVSIHGTLTDADFAALAAAA